MQANGQGAGLALDPTFTVEPSSALATSLECRTTGLLERQILDAVAEAA